MAKPRPRGQCRLLRLLRRSALSAGLRLSIDVERIGRPGRWETREDKKRPPKPGICEYRLDQGDRHRRCHHSQGGFRDRRGRRLRRQAARDYQGSGGCRCNELVDCCCSHLRACQVRSLFIVMSTGHALRSTNFVSSTHPRFGDQNARGRSDADFQERRMRPIALAYGPTGLE